MHSEVYRLPRNAKRYSAAEERDMWKAVTVARQSNLSVPIAPQVPQNAPQPTVLPAQATEFMAMLANMMSLSTQENVEKDLQGSL